MLVTSIYRPPNSKADLMDQLENYFNILDEQNKELIITGDLNCDLSLSVLQPHSCRLIDILEFIQLKQLIVDPTRITSNTKVNLTPSRELMGVSCFLRVAWSFRDNCVCFRNIVNLVNNL